MEHDRYARLMGIAITLGAVFMLACQLDAQTTGPAMRGARPATAPGTQPGGRRGGARVPAPKSVSPRDALPWTATNFDSLKPNLPTLIIAGDSTAETGSDAWHRGWGAVLIDYFDTSRINVVNCARGGRSSRSFLREGLWDRIVAALKPGDIVILQFGHNDGGDVNSPIGRADVRGTGDETQTVTHPDGSTEIVHTFSWYTRKFIKDVRDKGATPVVVAATPYNRWVDGKFQHRSGDFADAARKVAADENVQFMDQTAIIGDRYDQLGQQVVDSFFPADRILHTNTPGAIVNAECFVAGVKAMNIKPLIDALNEKGNAIEPYKPAPASEAR